MYKITEEVRQVLTTNELLENRVGLLALGGSLAYGTNLPNKGDIDTRGFVYEPAHQLIGGVANFETFIDTPSDTVLYSFNKIIKLLLENNPNTLEILGCNPEHYFYISSVGQEMIDNTDKFLSKRVFHTFGGYAKMQLERMERAIAHNSLEGRKVTEHLKGSFERALYSFNDRYSSYEKGSISARIVDCDDPDKETDLVLDMCLKGIPIDQVSGMLKEITNIKRLDGQLRHRNRKKDVESLDKHAMHIIRLLVTGIELMTTGKMRTYRAEEQEMLLSIRQGAFRNADGTYNSSFFDLKNELDTKFELAKKDTVLPDYPNREWVREFMFEVNKKIIEGNIDTLRV